MHLAHKPVHASLLGAMGPWPAYIASGALLALAMFAVLPWFASAGRNVTVAAFARPDACRERRT